MVVNAEVNQTNKTTLGSARRSVVENSLTGPTLLEMSGYRVYEDLLGIGLSLRKFCQYEHDNIPDEDRDHNRQQD